MPMSDLMVRIKRGLVGDKEEDYIQTEPSGTAAHQTAC